MLIVVCTLIGLMTIIAGAIGSKYLPHDDGHDQDQGSVSVSIDL